MAYLFRHTVTDECDLHALVGQPSEVVRRSHLAALDRHARAFIARSPFALIGTAGADGRCDVSPRGDLPGFALALDDETLLLPERQGNRRASTLANILGNPHVGLIFVIPGVEDTLRVNGRAQLVRDADLLARCSVAGNAPTLGIGVHVEESFLHCARAFKRGRFWDAAAWTTAGELPSLAQMIVDQIGAEVCSVAALDRELAEDYRNLF